MAVSVMAAVMGVVITILASMGVRMYRRHGKNNVIQRETEKWESTRHGVEGVSNPGATCVAPPEQSGGLSRRARVPESDVVNKNMDILF